tara:strand:- start:265 stop:486 length:222 start_codon:yes stop_codon:yes gene_type:complete
MLPGNLGTYVYPSDASLQFFNKKNATKRDLNDLFNQEKVQKKSQQKHLSVGCATDHTHGERRHIRQRRPDRHS